ncbi:MAG: tetratricopeptide repeat protein [Pirellulales bacterium]
MHDPFHLVQRAWAAYQAGHYDRAEQEARGALALEPNDAEALSVLSLCAMQRSDRPNAVQLAEQAISSAADEAIYHYRLALIHGRFGDHKAAEPPLRATLELDPTFAPGYSLYAWVFFARGHYDIALGGIQEALKHDPFELYALNLRIDILSDKGDVEGALHAAEHALRVHPENKHAHAMLGVLQLKRRNRGSAVTHLQEALRIDPDTVWVRRAYVNALEGRAFPARLLMRTSRAVLAALVECSFVVPLFWVGYLRCRQGYGVATGWHPILLGLVVVFHGMVILAWWGPLLSFLTIPRSSEIRQIIGAEHGFLERTRVTYLWQLFVSAAILISSASIFIAGEWIAPFACAVGGVAIAMLVCALANTPAAWIASRVCAAAVCVLSVAWFLDPAALQSNRRAPRTPLAKCFPVAVIASVAIIPTLNEPRGKWLMRS